MLAQANGSGKSGSYVYAQLTDLRRHHHNMRDGALGPKTEIVLRLCRGMKSLQSVVALPSGKSRLRLRTGINLVEKPGSPLGLVDPVLDQAGCRDVVMPIADLMGRAQGT
jgi:hypothetical protein